MNRRAALVLAGWCGAFAGLGVMAACGARTGLPTEEIADAGSEFGLLFPDRFIQEDRGEEPKEEDVVEEPPPGIDVNVPDVPIINPCPDAAATLIYVIGTSGTLYSFQPPAGPFSSLGAITCPGAVGSPFSMAVDREGVAYVLFSKAGTGTTETGTGLFRVSTKDASCRPTAYDAAKYGGVTFGMGFVADIVDGSATTETLYVSKDASGDGVLGSIDTKTFALTYVGAYKPSVSFAELTGTVGKLFAFQPLTQGTTQSFIAQIDPSTAKVIGTDLLPSLMAGSGWAFGFWGGAFYTFTGTGPPTPSGQNSTVVNRYDPVKKTLTQVATLPTDTISGAGVSTCAPTGGT